MKMLLLALAFLSIGTNSFAQEVEPVKYVPVSLDQAFFKGCLESLQSFEGDSLSCQVLQVPEDREFVFESPLLNALNYLSNLSHKVCAESGTSLYAHIDDAGNLLLVAGSQSCLETVADINARAGYPIRNKIAYLVKKGL